MEYPRNLMEFEKVEEVKIIKEALKQNTC